MLAMTIAGMADLIAGRGDRRAETSFLGPGSSNVTRSTRWKCTMS
jgi:hypothetical protein